MDRSDVPPFSQVVAEQSAFIRRTLAQLGVPARELDDAVQEVLQGVARGLCTFDPALSVTPSDPVKALRAWLFTICERKAFGARAGELRRGELFCTAELDMRPALEPSAEDVLQERERVALLDRLLALLDPHRRAVVVAHELQGVPMGEVAAALGIPVHTAWNRRRLGLDDLRALCRGWARRSR